MQCIKKQSLSANPVNFLNCGPKLCDTAIKESVQYDSQGKNSHP